MGGHGGLNILPQKSWNVYNYDNREKVRKDEEEEAQRLQQEKEQQLRVEAEVRHTKLLERAQAKRRRGPELEEEGEGTTRASSSVGGASGSRGAVEVKQEHINLFEGLIGGDADTPMMGGGAAREEGIGGTRKMGKVEAADRKGKLGGMGLEAEDLRFSLGHCAGGHKPWYTMRPPPPPALAPPPLLPQPLSRTAAASPLPAPSQSRNAVHHDKRSASLPPAAVLQQREPPTATAKTQGKRKRSIEELRADRLQREQHERDRARKVLVGQIAASKGSGCSGLGGADNHHSSASSSNQPPQRYHSGFGNARR